jgi:hypothetical protein
MNSYIHIDHKVLKYNYLLFIKIIVFEMEIIYIATIKGLIIFNFLLFKLFFHLISIY